MNFINDFAAIPAITVLCLLAAEGYKLITKEQYNKHIPLFCGVFGLVLGVVTYFALPDYIPAENYLVAGVMGVVSGWAATGVHQVVKQERKGASND